MTLFTSVALFRRDGKLTFKPPRKEASHEKTQARKASARFWNSRITDPDKLLKIVLVNCIGHLAYVSEKALNSSWVEYQIDLAAAEKHPHIAACLAELGVDPSSAPSPLPDTLEINGVIYRREI